MVSASMVRSVLKSDFVDMAELSEEHLVETISDGKPLPPHKLRTVPDILTWARSFCHFAGSVVQDHPDKAVDLWAYLAFMLSGGEVGTGGGHVMPALDNSCLLWRRQGLGV